MAKYALVVALLVGLSDSAFARDDGRYANDPLKYWLTISLAATGSVVPSLTAFRLATLIGTRRTVIIACCCTANG